jgi:hypothetical protein
VPNSGGKATAARSIRVMARSNGAVMARSNGPQ